MDLSLNIKYSNGWRDVGIFIAFIAFNASVTVLHVLWGSRTDMVYFAGGLDLPLYVLVLHEAVGRIKVV